MLKSKAVSPNDYTLEAELRLVGGTTEGDDGDDVMVADLSRDDTGSRRPAGMFPAARGVGSSWPKRFGTLSSL